MDKVNVSIIIVNYNTESLIANCLESIYKMVTGVTYEIIIVDNNSSLQSKKDLSALENGKVKIIWNTNNDGYGKANNLGAAIARGKYLFFLNPDTLLMNDAVSILSNVLENDNQIGCVGGNLFTKDNRPNGSFSLIFDDFETELKKSNWFSVIWNQGNRYIYSFFGRNDKSIKTFNNSSENIEVSYIFGADLMISKVLFTEVGGFDPSFFMYYEEQELQRRISNNGLKILNNPEAKIIHLEGQSTSTEDEFSPRQFKLRMEGKANYFELVNGNGSGQTFVASKRKEIIRIRTLAKLLRRNKLYELTSKQLKVLEEW